jgi:hypothetical protein
MLRTSVKAGLVVKIWEQKLQAIYSHVFACTWLFREHTAEAPPGEAMAWQLFKISSKEGSLPLAIMTNN